MRKLRMGLIGGGGEAFIGRVHAIAATLDLQADLVAGALSSDPRKARDAAPSFGISEDRAYGSFQELLNAEATRGDEDRIDFVSIATPNHTHFEIAREAVAAGFNVVCDKPLTLRLEEAKSLAKLVRERQVVFAVSHNYSGYPLVRQARDMIRGGELGRIEAVRVNYMQGWLRGLQPDSVPQRGSWKSDPAKAGSGSLGDVGTHAFQLMRYVTGIQPSRLSALVRNFSPARSLDDYSTVLLKCDDGPVGMITISQVTHGRWNDLAIEVDGDRGSLAWRQEQPNELNLYRFGEPRRVIERHPPAPFMTASATAACRIPGGHPEGFFEAFANVYRAAYEDMRQRDETGRVELTDRIYPTVDDGVEGVRFIEQCLASGEADGQWMEL